MANALRKLIKSGTSAFAIAEKADADALPIAGTEGEGFASSGEMEAIGAERELMTIGLTVIRVQKGQASVLLPKREFTHSPDTHA